MPEAAKYEAAARQRTYTQAGRQVLMSGAVACIMRLGSEPISRRTGRWYCWGV